MAQRAPASANISRSPIAAAMAPSTSEPSGTTRLRSSYRRRARGRAPRRARASGSSVLVAPMNAIVPTPIGKSTPIASLSDGTKASARTPHDISSADCSQSRERRSRCAKYAVTSAPPNPPTPIAETAQPKPRAPACKTLTAKAAMS